MLRLRKGKRNSSSNRSEGVKKFGCQRKKGLLSPALSSRGGEGEESPVNFFTASQSGRAEIGAHDSCRASACVLMRVSCANRVGLDNARRESCAPSCHD